MVALWYESWWTGIQSSRFNPRLPKGWWLPPSLRIIFRPAEMLDFTIKWVQLIVGSPFPVIFVQKILLSYPGVG